MGVGFWRPIQRVVGYPGGQCVRTSYASLLDLPIDAVPDFSPAALQGRPQVPTEKAWLNSLGLDLIVVPRKKGAPAPKIPGDMFHLMSVLTPRHPVHGHRVVGLGGKVVHDPHPGGVPATSVRAYLFVVPKK